MKRMVSEVAVACMVLAIVVACRSGGPLYQVTDAPIQTATGKEPSLEEVQKAIIQAGAGLGWNMSVVKPGEITGTLNVRSHQAVVTIPYTSKSYHSL